MPHFDLEIQDVLPRGFLGNHRATESSFRLSEDHNTVYVYFGEYLGAPSGLHQYPVSESSGRQILLMLQNAPRWQLWIPGWP